jgi:hypothetical protein
LFDEQKSGGQRLLVKLHGFADSPLGLLWDSQNRKSNSSSHKSRARNANNSLTLCFDLAPSPNTIAKEEEEEKEEEALLMDKCQLNCLFMDMSNFYFY